MKRNPLFKEFEAALKEARVSIKVAKKTNNQNIIKDIKTEPENAFKLLPEVEKSLEDIQKSVQQDISRYIPKTPEEQEQNTPEDNTEYCFIKINSSTEEEIETPIISEKKSSDFLTKKLKLALHKPLQAKDLINNKHYETLTNDERYLYMLIAKEIDNTKSTSLVLKLKKILSPVEGKRIEEAIILTKNLKMDDPHNHVLAFILSQLLYFKASHSHTECLPEAREEAKKSCSYTDKFNEAKLLRYRYHSIATERHFSPEKALELMREYFMINPESLTGKDGIYANNFYNLRCWIILSTIPTSLWNIFEVESLKEISQKAIGGTLIYIYYLRHIIISEIDSANDMFIINFTDLENQLLYFYNDYNKLKSLINNNFNSNNTIIGSEPYIWITPHRYLERFLSLAPTPSSDEILMHMSLDGRLSEKDAYPEKNMIQEGLEHNNYWSSWAIALTPFHSNRRESILPIERIVEFKKLFNIYNNILEKLEALEKDIIKKEIWDEIEYYMPLYSYENLLEIGYGGPSTQLLRTKEDASFLPYYRLWRKSTTPSPLPSKMIKHQAENGGFINFKEVHTIFEGVHKVFLSTEYSLKAHVKKAREEFNINNEVQTGFSKYLSQGLWMYLIAIPLFALVAVAVLFSDDMFTTIKMLTMIIGGMLIFAVIAMLILPKKK